MNARDRDMPDPSRRGRFRDGCRGDEVIGACAVCGEDLRVWGGCYDFCGELVCRPCVREYLEANGYYRWGW